MQVQSNSCFITELVESFRFEDAKLPSMPDAVIYLENAIRDETVNLSELASLLEKDPVLAARLIRVSNSAYYRAVAPVETVPAAVTRIGFSATRNIALVLLGNSFHARHSLISERINQLWVEALRTGAVAGALTRQYPLVDANRAMLGGLMYNVGPMLLLTKIDARVQSIPHPMIIEHMIDNHARLFGRKLLEHWEMDPDLLDVVSNRDNWQRNHDESPDLTDLILLARSCLPMPDGSPPDFAACGKLPCYQRMQRFMHLTQSLEDTVAEAEESIKQTLSLIEN